ncbi:GH3 auxin-responsive promoter family protein [archaeon]|nr:GH3 auxin-responsive promoter family protein [archaeon]NCP79084.1 GH3 auxin-responsive promoter family protein [archaeon]NCP97534.1 GH3 auxin-responsive promoter family protein [archaeon]NCQ06851.1 GH3 auxin-responsive promoter family protein [archaeon]NCQ50647.1 GH3 auxin-responsive promoter family protein [archaeon]
MNPIKDLKTASEKIKQNSEKLKDDFINYKYILNQIKQIIDFQDALIDPLKSQKKILKKIIKRNKNTEYGKKYSFSKIKTIEDFQKQVPIIKYNDISEDIEEIKKGKQNIFTRDKVVYFASTSGTTSKIKLIPVTKQRIKNYNKEFALWAVYVLKDYVKIANGKTLYFAGPYFEGKTKGKIPYGSISGYLPFKSPWYVKKKISNPINVYNEMNFNKKIKKMAIHALQENITQIAFTAPIEAILFLDYIKENKTKLIKIIKKKNSKRAEYLSKIDDFKAINIWPNIGLVSCFRSKTNEMYIDTLMKKIGKKIEIRDPGINASEGRISIGISKDGISGVFPLNTTFFEFIDFNKEKKEIITVDKLKLNRKYKVIITTQEGLYRYDMGDVVKVTSFFKKIPEIKFFTRENYLNIAGELAYEDEIVKALKKSFTEENFKIKYYTVIPYLKDLSKKPRYEILLDLEENKTEKEIIKLKEKIDLNLKETINDYKQMREEFGRMDMPVISILEKNSYDEFNKKRVVGSGNPKPINIHPEQNFRENFKIKKTYE